jgi:hypothetical protein
VVACFLDPILNSQVRSQILDQVILAKDNAGTWGTFPGKYDIFISRNATIFNFQNPLNAMLKKEMPIFEESAVLSYRESSKVENLEYIDEDSDEKKYMKMDQTIWFDPVNQDQTQTDLLASEVNIPNIAALGAWQSITTYNNSKIASGAFSGMMSSLNKDNAAIYLPLSISVHNMFIPDETKFMTVIDSVKDLTQETKGQLWSHAVYGFYKQENLVPWMKATVEGPTSAQALILRNHFYMSTTQITQTINALTAMVEASKDTLAARFQCPDNICTAAYLTATQWANQGLTKGLHLKPIKPLESITFVNATVFGYPEFSYFYESRFLPGLPDNEKADYAGIVMDVETALRLTATSLDATKPVTAEDTLSNDYNQLKLWEWGLMFDGSKDLNNLQPAMNRFKLKDLKLTRVVWEYVKYIRLSWATFDYKDITPGAKGT